MEEEEEEDKGGGSRVSSTGRLVTRAAQAPDARQHAPSNGDNLS
jgi:hypothetical protein